MEPGLPSRDGKTQAQKLLAGVWGEGPSWKNDVRLQCWYGSHKPLRGLQPHSQPSDLRRGFAFVWWEGCRKGGGGDTAEYRLPSQCVLGSLSTPTQLGSCWDRMEEGRGYIRGLPGLEEDTGTSRGSVNLASEVLKGLSAAWV